MEVLLFNITGLLICTVAAVFGLLYIGKNWKTQLKSQRHGSLYCLCRWLFNCDEIKGWILIRLQFKAGRQGILCFIQISRTDKKRDFSLGGSNQLNGNFMV